VKILVPIKRVPDPELKVKLKDGAIDLAGASWVVNTFDEYAVETALRLRENGASGESHGEVVVVTIGPDDAGQQLRSALAMGADRAIRIDGEDKALDSRVVAAVLAKVIEAEKPDLVDDGQAGRRRRRQPGRPDAGRQAWAGRRRPSPPPSSWPPTRRRSPSAARSTPASSTRPSRCPAC
jgi:electron transfer flavoprotein beta subunit